MISLHIVFYLMILFFAMIGYLRGWQKEVIALTGLVASIAALSIFGARVLNIPSATADPNLGLEAAAQASKFRFWVQAFWHCIIAFFSYQVVTRFADQVSGGRIGERVRANIEKRIVGALIGAINGYLFVGGLWAFLEYEITPSGYVQLAQGAQYAFFPVVTRPDVGTTAMNVATKLLPLTQSIDPTWWLIFFFVAFFVVIIALI
jgi:uncharacterized membrane protein required for colicin V production